ncbi:sugar ABC transporter ATP-binding protein [Thermopolyspora sp. NPDC052614]|uniref:sugar ABC transporter ATP-binding protein n=1 Tax=Thermopolyspora sp. NPDC052614 TaxID=3155682 RepID=UPI00342136DA
MPSPPAPVLSIDRVRKSFPGVRALDDVSFDVAPGSFHALVGGNGCGKSTLIKTLAGVHQAGSGTITVRGTSVPADSVTPAWSHASGIRFVHQDLGLFGTMSVAENMFVGRPYPRTGGAISWTALRREAQACLDRLGIDIDVRRPLSRLRPAEHTLIAIARCLFDQADGGVALLVLDEPTARLPQAEVDELLGRLDRYVRDGQSILYVSHRLDEVLEHADTVTVLRDGRHVRTGPAAGLTRQDLTAMIVGSHRELAAERASRPIDPEVVLQVEGLTGGPLRDVSLEVHRGEIVAVAGLVGSGRTSLLETVFGVHRPLSGRVVVKGRRLKPGAMTEAIAAGVAYVPEDRAGSSAFPDLGLDMNMSAASLPLYRRGWLRRRLELKAAEEDIARFSVRTPGTRAPFAHLSGGNQQKAVVARWLRLRPALLLLDEPTQGVDVGARAEIYAQIESAVESGASVLLVTSDLDELLHLADRVVVMSNGRIVETSDHTRITRGWVTTRMFDAAQEKK